MHSLGVVVAERIVVPVRRVVRASTALKTAVPAVSVRAGTPRPPHRLAALASLYGSTAERQPAPFISYPNANPKTYHENDPHGTRYHHPHFHRYPLG